MTANRTASSSTPDSAAPSAGRPGLVRAIRWPVTAAVLDGELFSGEGSEGIDASGSSARRGASSLAGAVHMNGLPVRPAHVLPSDGLLTERASRPGEFGRGLNQLRRSRGLVHRPCVRSPRALDLLHGLQFDRVAGASDVEEFPMSVEDETTRADGLGARRAGDQAGGLEDGPMVQP
jgi:hypothetical protein